MWDENESSGGVEAVESEVKLDEMGVNDNEICGDRRGPYNFCPRASSSGIPWRTRAVETSPNVMVARSRVVGAT